MPTVKNVIRFLQENYKEDEIVAWNCWTVEDIRDYAKQMHKRVSHVSAEKIVEDIHYQQDASIGINWDVIEEHIRMAIGN